MNDYHPNILGLKWGNETKELLPVTRREWESRSRRPLLKLREADWSRDWITPGYDKYILERYGYVVWGHFARAFLGAYVPGIEVFFGSVVYSTLRDSEMDVIELAYRANQLREDDSTPPPGTERVANAMRNDQSQFSRILLPKSFELEEPCYLANIGILRDRLPLGYIHDRMVPIVIAPKLSRRCCLLPLRFWPDELKRLWSSGMPAYEPEPFLEALAQMGIQP